MSDWLVMSDWLAYLQGVQAIVTVVGLPFLIWQLYHVARQARYQHHYSMSQVYQHTVVLFNDITKYFADHPEYIPYFYKNKNVSDRDPDFDRIYLLAEWYLDTVHDLLVHKNYIPEYPWEDVWLQSIQEIYWSSPIMQRVLKERRSWWTPEVYQLLEGNKPTNQVDVVVVGAGLSGLVAARDLLAAQRSVLVLEAQDHVGGRILNYTLANGAVIELGGQWVGPTQDRVLALADELGIELYPTYVDGEHLLALDGCTKRYRGDTLDLPEEVREDIAKTRQRLYAMASAVSLEEPWHATDAALWDAETVDTWLINNTKTPLELRYWRRIIPAIFAAETVEISLLHFLFYCKSGGSIRRLGSTSGGAQESRLIGGSQQLALKLAAQLGDAVWLNTPVVEVRYSNENVEVVYAGGTIVASYVIVAIPPALAARVRYAPALPPLRDQLTQRIPIGYVIKVQLVYTEPFWRSEGLSGYVFSFDDEVIDIFDNSPQDLSCGVLLGFVVGDYARQLGKLSPNERKDLIISRFVRFFGPRAKDLIEYVEKDWTTEEWTRGCYSGHLGTGVWTQYGAALRPPIGRIYWAGTETAEVWNGYMDGAVRSGERAAQEVLSTLDRAKGQSEHLSG